MKLSKLCSLLFLLFLWGCQNIAEDFDSPIYSELEGNLHSEVRAGADDYVQYYNFPSNANDVGLIPRSPDYSVKINNRDYFVYKTPNIGRRQDGCSTRDDFGPNIVSFGIKRNIPSSYYPKLIIKPLNRSINSFIVRPKRFNNTGFTATRGSDGSIILEIKSPMTLSVEINGDIGSPLLVFANEIEVNPPAKGSVSRYYEAGKVHNIGHTPLNLNESVYIEPGAIVRGSFAFPVGASNMFIKGRGILNGEEWNATYSKGYHALNFRNATNCTIEGITLVNCKWWAVPLYGCTGITIDGIRIVSNTGWEDGIDIVGGQDITIKNSFIWTKDDCIAIKAGVNYNWNDFNAGIHGKRNIRNIRINNCVLRNGVNGNALEIGRELNTGTIEDVIYENIDLIHTQCPCGLDEGALSINNHGNGIVKNIKYKNIYIEDVERYLFNIKVQKDPLYSPPNGSEYQFRYGGGDPSYNGGRVEDITYENIFVDRVVGSNLHSGFIVDKDLGQRVKNIQFINFRINSQLITSYSSANLNANGFVLFTQGVSNITFR